jgi:hypothetical protein
VLAGIGRTRDLQSLEHEVAPLVPALQQTGARPGLEVLNKGLPGCQGLPHEVVRLIHPAPHRREQTRAEIQGQEPGRQVRLALAVVMLERIAWGVEGVGVRGLDVPAGSAGLHDGLHLRVSPGVLRRHGMAIQEGAGGGLGAGQFTPMAPHGSFALAPGDLGGLPRGGEGANPPLPAAAGERLERAGHFSPSPPRVQRGGRRRWADHAAVDAVGEPEGPAGWWTVALVPEAGGLQRPSRLACTPPLGGDLGTILLRLTRLGGAALGLPGMTSCRPGATMTGGIAW